MGDAVRTRAEKGPAWDCNKVCEAGSSAATGTVPVTCCAPSAAQLLLILVEHGFSAVGTGRTWTEITSGTFLVVRAYVHTHTHTHTLSIYV